MMNTTTNLLAIFMLLLHIFGFPRVFAQANIPNDILNDTPNYLNVVEDEKPITEEDPVEHPPVMPSVVDHLKEDAILGDEPLILPMNAPVVDPEETLFWKWIVEDDETKSALFIFNDAASGLWVDCGTGAGPQFHPSGLIKCPYEDAGTYQFTLLNPQDLRGYININNSNNNITELWLGNAKNIQHLYIRNNPITSFAPGAFDRLSEIMEIEIQNTLLHTLPPGAFDKNPLLKTVNLAQNQISYLPDDIFKHLSHLGIIDLKSNLISQLPTGIFDHLPLKTLDLSDNPLVSLPKGFFDNINFLDYPSINIGYTCLNIEDEEITDYLDSFQVSYYTKYVCADVQYIPNTPTTGQVKGVINFVGPTSLVEILKTENLHSTGLSHYWTGNTDFSFQIADIKDTHGYLRDYGQKNYTTIPAKVSRIIDDCPDGDYSGDDKDGSCGDVPRPPVSSAGGGGGGGVTLRPDNCPQGDFSPSYYDGECGEMTPIDIPDNPPTIIEDTGHASAEGPTAREKLEIDNDDEAASLITRAEMAEMLVRFSTNIFPMLIETSARQGCAAFSDLSQVSTGLQSSIIKACALGLMGYYADGITTQPAFYPNRNITLAEVAVTISRLLRGATYNGIEEWRYHNHLLVTQKINIIPSSLSPTHLVKKEELLTIFLKLLAIKNAL